jgi:hypothetical protein
MTLFTSLGTSADCMGLTEVPIYQMRTCNALAAPFAFTPLIYAHINPYGTFEPDMQKRLYLEAA